MGVGGKSMEVAFATVPSFSVCEDTQNLEVRVHVAAWTQHSPFAILDPITFMKGVCIIPKGGGKAMSRETFVLLIHLSTFLSLARWGWLD